MSNIEAEVLRHVQLRPSAEERTQSVPRQIQLRSWLVATVVVDGVCAVAAALAASRFRFGDAVGSPGEYLVLTACLPVLWVALLVVSGSYDRRWVTTGAEPFRRVFDSGVMLLAVAAIASFLFKAQLSREWVGVTALVLTVLTIAGRYAGRKRLHQMIAAGRAFHRVLVAGSGREVINVAKHMRRASYAGFSVLAVCQLDSAPHLAAIAGVPAFESDMEGLFDTAVAVGADTIAIAGSSSLPDGSLRRLAWQLEGSKVQLVVAPAVSDFAGPRIIVRPVDGLPLLTIDQPDFTGIRRVAKDAIDWAFAAGLLVIAAPLALAIGIAIKVADRGPIFFRQERVGRHGEVFHIWKFRTMTTDAERQLALLRERNEHDGFLFKIREDPRVTRVGRFLRRHSLDELPQLFNVVKGEMSLVGPRPPLPAEVEMFEDESRRRLLVKPGMTGLWQINGRSDLPWEEAVRLDLHYVENWSVALDVMVLWKTLAVVVRGKGGY